MEGINLRLLVVFGAFILCSAQISTQSGTEEPSVSTLVENSSNHVVVENMTYVEGYEMEANSTNDKLNGTRNSTGNCNTFNSTGRIDLGGYSTQTNDTEHDTNEDNSTYKAELLEPDSKNMTVIVETSEFKNSTEAIDNSTKVEIPLPLEKEAYSKDPELKSTLKSATRKRSINGTKEVRVIEPTVLIPKSDEFITEKRAVSFSFSTNKSPQISVLAEENVDDSYPTDILHSTLTSNISETEESLHENDKYFETHADVDLPREDVKTMDEIERESEAILRQPSQLNVKVTEPVMKHIKMDEEAYTGKVSVEIDDSSVGVTFDPDGMTHDGPKDPDSIVFSPNPFDTKKLAPQIASTETQKNPQPDHGISHEREIEFEGESNYKIRNESNNDREREDLDPFYRKSGLISTVASLPEDIGTESEYIAINDSKLSTPSPNNLSLTHVKLTVTTDVVEEYKNDTGAVHSFIDDEGMMQDSPHRIPENETYVSTAAPIDKGLSSKPFSNAEIIATNSHPSTFRPTFIEMTSPQEESSNVKPIPPYSASSNPSVSTYKPSTGPKYQSEMSTGKATNIENLKPTVLPNPAPATDEVKVQHPEPTAGSDKLADAVVSDIDKDVLNAQSLPTEINNTSVHPVAISIVHHKIVVTENNANSSDELTLSLNDTMKTLTTDPTLSSTTQRPTTGPKIRKPKLKSSSATESDVPRTPKPFTPSPPKRASSTSGPPVAIFSRNRTRIASITSSTTPRTFNYNRLSTIRTSYLTLPGQGIFPNSELVISTEPVTTPVPTTTETEEPFTEEHFTGVTFTPTVTSEDNLIVMKIACNIVLEKGLRWNNLLENRHSPEYKKKAEFVKLRLERLFRSSEVATRVWKIDIDGFSNNRNSRSVAVDFFLYLMKSADNIEVGHLVKVFHEKLSDNNTFSRFRVDPSQTYFELISEEPLKTTPPPDDDEREPPPIPQWVIAVIVIGTASIIFIVLFAAVTMYGRHHMRRRYSNKLNEDENERSSAEWEAKMAAAYENLAADTIYDAEDLHTDSYKKGRLATFHGYPDRLQRCDSWSSNWSTAPRRTRTHHVHR